MKALTTEDFDDRLYAKCLGMTVAGILSTPEVIEIFAEEFNNAIISEFELEQEGK